jgi:hypothetical protein
VAILEGGLKVRRALEAGLVKIFMAGLANICPHVLSGLFLWRRG